MCHVSSWISFQSFHKSTLFVMILLKQGYFIFQKESQWSNYLFRDSDYIHFTSFLVQFLLAHQFPRVLQFLRVLQFPRVPRSQVPQFLRAHQFPPVLLFPQLLSVYIREIKRQKESTNWTV